VAGTTLTIRPPEDYALARDVCSYGYFLLAPNRWDVDARALSRPLGLPAGPAACVIDQPMPAPGSPLRARFDRRLERREHAPARAQIARMLRLDESADDVRGFHRVDPRWRRSGRGRLFRSPTLFEDVVKTVTSCNVSWPSTIRMNQRLCAVLGSKSPAGERTFPTPARLARTRPGTLRARCRVGYRDQRLIALAGLFHRGEIDEAWLDDPSTGDEEAFVFLRSLPGIGPYAAGNIMQLLGRYSRLALDTESVRHARAVLGMTGEDREILRRLEAHYEPFGAHRFRSYWFELWADYEARRGPAESWDRDTTGRTFTASQLG
jgi:3-methyladenine DNA glycosylase/8-oxoguanine DNA glycosylase